MRKLLFQLSIVLMLLQFCFGLKAQNVIEVPYTNFSDAPVIDGKTENYWDSIPIQYLNVEFSNELVSFTASSTLQAAWNNQFIYIMVSVPDDDFYPGGEANLASWLADKVELYFDVNDTIVDGKGPAYGTYSGAGHYQVTSPFEKDSPDQILTPHNFAFNVSNDSTSYWCEYAIPFTSLKNKENKQIDPYLMDTIGFDVTVIDLDEYGNGPTFANRQRINWNNDGTVNESWNNMDNCGRMVFTGGDQCDTSYRIVNNIEILKGDSYTFYGKELTEPGTYTEQFVTYKGCDSIHVLNLKVFDGKIGTIDYQNYTEAPTIDGEIEALWNSVPKFDIITPFYNETVTFNAAATWQAIWDNQNIYLLVTVPDDNFLPYYDTTLASWLADKVEVYFDINDTIVDGKGPAIYQQDNEGHYQFAPEYEEVGKNAPTNYSFAYKVSPNDDTYICEYAFPFSTLVDKNNKALNPYVMDTIGFDITIIDLDEPGYTTDSIRQRVNWSTSAIYGESWNTMDNCGRLVFNGGHECKAIDTTFIEATIAADEVYEFLGQSLYTEGVYHKTLVTDQGCDSVFTLTLTTKFDTSKTIQYMPQTAPVIDGQIDEVWNSIPRKPIKASFGGESVSYYATPTWRSMWNDTAIFILISVPDDNFYPSTEAGTASYLADKPEIYFDVNSILTDSGGPAWNKGHYQIAPGFSQVGNNKPTTFQFGYSVENDALYVCEYAIPFTKLYDEDGRVFDPLTNKTCGFDITLIDLDEAGKGMNQIKGRINYSNSSDSLTDESWLNMDRAALLNFEGYKCSEIDTTFLTEVICEGDSLYFGSQYIKSAGIYYNSALSQYYCDSVIALTLKVNAIILTTASKSICKGETFTFGSNLISETGIYYDTLISHTGCDSVIELAVSLTEVNKSISQNDAVLTANATDAHYQWINCSEDNYGIINDATEQTYTVNGNGYYAVIVTENNCTDTSDCINVIIQNIDNENLSSISLYPNPASHKLNIDFDVEFNHASIEVYNAIGTLIKNELILNNQNTIDIAAFTKGIYILRIIIDDNIYNYQLVKQ